MRTGTWLPGSILPAGMAAALCLAGCRSETGPPTPPEAPVDQARVEAEGDEAMTIEISSTAFAEGEPIPKKYTGEGEDVSPPLAWDKLPEGTRQLALICDDPDAPTPEPWVHWVIYKIPADAGGLAEGVAQDAEPADPAGACQGKNSWTDGQTIGYRGPMPPPGHGTHRYFFKLYALDEPLAIGPGVDKQTLLEKMSGHVIGRGQLMGTYER